MSLNIILVGLDLLIKNLVLLAFLIEESIFFFFFVMSIQGKEKRDSN
jgi:hypothetical protein